MFNLDNIEKKQNIKLPKEYKKLYQSNFKEIGNEVKIYAGSDIFSIRKFLTATEINDILDELYNFFGYDIIPIAETDYEDYICLDYRDDMESPTIIYWNYELASEDLTEGTVLLYNNMHEFLVDVIKVQSSHEK